MSPIIRNILAVIVGLFVGGALNGFLIKISGSIIPPPVGSDLTTEEGLKAAMSLMEPKHFLMPWLAHALGTLVGAFLTAKLAASYQLRLALLIGVFFLVGGIMMVMMLPSPMWFTMVDLLGAYLPMAYLGAMIAARN
jgi:hypothetical protein